MPDSPDTNMTPDRQNMNRSSSPERARVALVHEIKQQFRRGEAMGFVNARTNFDLIQDDNGNQKPVLSGSNTRGGGFPVGGGLFYRGDIDNETANSIYGEMMSFDQQNKRFEPKQPGELCISIAKPQQVKEVVGGRRVEDRMDALVQKIGEDKTIIEARYKQPDSDDSHRTSVKSVFLIVPDQTAAQFTTIKDPNEMHTVFRDVFTTESTKDLFDVALVEQSDPTKPRITPKQPAFTQIRAVGFRPKASATKPNKKTEIQVSLPQEIEPPVPEPANITPPVSEKYELRRLRELVEQREKREIGSYIELVRRLQDHLSTDLPSIDTEPDNFFENPPEWYNVLNTQERRMVRAYFTLNYLAGKKLRSGRDEMLDNCISPEGFALDRRAMDEMWMNMPGFRQAKTTIVRELCTIDPQGRLILSEQGRKKLSNGRDAYLDSLEEKLKVLFHKYPDFINSSQAFLPLSTDIASGERIDLAAQQAAQAAWSLFYMGGVIESANRDFELKSGPELQQGSLLQLYHPRDWLSFRLRDGQPDKFSLAWAGNLGEWYRFEYVNEASFKKEYSRGKYEYIPKTMAISWYDYITYGKGRYSQGDLSRTFGQVLVQEAKQIRGVNGLYDVFDDDARMGNLGSMDDLWFKYSSTTGQVRKLYEVITGATELEKRDPGKIAEAVKVIYEDGRFASDKYLRELYTSDDFVLALIVMAAGEPLKGSPDLIPAIDPNIYSEKVYQVISKFNDVFATMKGGANRARERILERLHAQDMSKRGLVPIYVTNLPGSGVRKLRKQAERRVANDKVKSRRSRQDNLTY